MKKYRKVMKFKYENNYYNMYIDNKNKHYFLRIGENDKLYYPNINEYISLVNYFTNVKNVMYIKKDKPKKIGLVPKVVIGATAFTLTSSIAFTAFASHRNKQSLEEWRLANANREIEIEYISLDDEELTEEFELDTYFESQYSDYVYVYDNDYLDKVLPKKNITYDDLCERINNNSKINANFKNLLKDYSKSVCETYPDIDLRIFYKNLETLEVVECDKNELVSASLSFDSYGCYVKDENKIYVEKDKIYEKGTWDYQVIFHEFSHCLRIGYWDIDGKLVRVSGMGTNYNSVIMDEALNSLFTVNLFDYEERDIAYQLQSNYLNVIIESMDNYEIADYADHSTGYFAMKLDEFNGNDNYATVMLNMIEAQYDAYHDDKIEIEQSELYPLYRYISNMYYKKNITSDMSYEEAKIVTDTLLEKILYDVPEEYNIDVDYFYTFLDEYCNTIGIDTVTYTR